MWHQSHDGQRRLYFLTNGRTYFGSQDGYVWRNSGDDIDLMTLTNGGDLSLSGSINTSG